MVDMNTDSPSIAKYAKEELAIHSQALFNCKPEVVTGALYDSKQNEFTIEEVKQLIHQFMQRKVK